MASSLEFMEYVFDQTKDIGEITYKKMFSEYCVYYKDKVVGLVCDDQFLIKKTTAGKEMLPNSEEIPPYKGSKPCILIENLDDKEILKELILKTYDELP
jgi:TfoX/Sxy family transcriptional regulator of competence genes